MYPLVHFCPKSINYCDRKDINAHTDRKHKHRQFNNFACCRLVILRNTKFGKKKRKKVHHTSVSQIAGNLIS